MVEAIRDLILLSVLFCCHEAVLQRALAPAATKHLILPTVKNGVHFAPRSHASRGASAFDVFMRRRVHRGRTYSAAELIGLILLISFFF